VAARVGPTGRVAGIDYDPAMVREARASIDRHSPRHAPVWHLIADAAGLPYRAGSFDACYSERVLQHTRHPAAIVREMARVTKPGGPIVIADTDWATLSIDAPDLDVERALVRFVGDALRNGCAGRQIRRLMTCAGLDDIRVELWPLVWTDYSLFRATSAPLLGMDARAVRAGAVSADDLAGLHHALADADRHGAFFASGAVVVARGRARGRHASGGSEQEES
jgi:SAM-dependent methyltransferase